MSERGGTGTQAGQPGSSPQAGQGGQNPGNNQPGFSEQVFGAPASQQGQPTQQTQTTKPTGTPQPGAEQGTRLEGQRDGETAEQFAQRLYQELSRTRKEAGNYRTQLRELKGDPEPGADGLTDYQRLQGQVTQLANALKAERDARKAEQVSTSLIAALADAGAVNPSRAIRLIDVSTELELGQDGQPTPESVQGAISRLTQEMPGIFNDVRGSGDGGAGNQGGYDPNDFNAQLRARARR